MNNRHSNQNSWKETDIQWEERMKREDAEENLRLWEQAKEVNELLKELTPQVKNSSPIKANPIDTHEVGEMKSSTATLSSISVDEIPASTSKYVFPISELGPYKEWESEDILDNLDSLSQTANKIDQYLFSRKAYCALSLELNFRGLIAPAFRPSPTIPKSVKKYSDAHRAIQIDRLVIDCHWLHARGESVYLSESKWKGILNMSKDFSFERVSEFASQKIKNEYRATAIMGLTTRQQLQMLALRSEEVQELYANLYKSIREPGKKRQPPKLELIEMAINQWCEADPRVVPNRPAYVALAKAIELMGKSSPTQLGELMGLMLGVPPLAESTVRQKIIKLRKVLDKYATP